MTISATSSNDFDPKRGAIIDDTDSDREEIEIDSHSASQKLDSSFGASVASRSQGTTTFSSESSSSNPNPSPYPVNSTEWLDNLIKECVYSDSETDYVMMEGMYSTATEQWKGEWFSPSNPTIRSRFTYKSTTWVTDKLPCKICNVVDEVDAFYCDMCDEAYHHHCIGWPTGKKEPKKWFCSEFGRNCQKVIDTWGPIPTSKIYKGSFKMKGRVDRVQESFVLKFRYLPSLASTSVDSPSICADAFGVRN